MSVGDLEQAVSEIVDNGLILEPGLPADILAERLVSEADPEFAAEFARSLMIDAFARRIRTARAKLRESRYSRPDEFRHLPLYIRIPGKKAVRFDRVTYRIARSYYWLLGRKQNDKKRADPKRLEAKALMDRLHAKAQKTTGITAGEVLNLDFGE